MVFLFLVEYLVEIIIDGILFHFYKILAYYIDLSLLQRISLKICPGGSEGTIILKESILQKSYQGDWINGVVFFYCLFFLLLSL